jgi:hypothetical protein
MHHRRIRLKKEYRLKAKLFIIITFSLCLVLIPKSNRAAMISFFSRNCRSYQQVYSRKLNDRITDYAEQARSGGIEKCADAKDIGNRIFSGKLLRV